MAVALREIRRSKTRFLLLSAAVGLLVFLLLFFQAVAGALVVALTGALERTSADLLVYDDTARANPAVSLLAADVTRRVAAVPGVDTAAPVAQTFAVATRGGKDQDAVVVGIDIGAPGTPARVDEGRLPAAAGEALFGSTGFAPPFAVGDEVALGEADLAITVVGVAEDAAFNASATLFVPLATYERLIRARIGPRAPVPASYVAVAVDDGSDVAAVAAGIDASVGGVAVLQRDAAVQALPGISTITRSFGVLYLLLYLVVAIVTGVFFLILTVQKRDTLLLLRAVGAERRDLVRLVLTQVALVVGVGVLVGAALATALLRATERVFGASVAAPTVATSGLAVLALGLLAATGAVRRVAAIEPVEATRATGLS